jgi:hypothetical protein
MRWNVLVAVVLTASSLVGSVRADITYTYVTDASNYTAAAGGSVTVNVYLDESITGGSQALIGPGGSEKGLFAAGIGANLVSGGATISGASSNSNSATATYSGNPKDTSGPGFGSANQNQTNTSSDGTNSAVLNEIQFGATAPKAYNVSSSGGTTVNQVYLGSFTINAGTSGTSTFSITSFNNSPNSLALQFGDSTQTSPNGDILDQDGQDPTTGVNFFGTEDTPTTFTVTVAAVPEPNGLLLSGLIVPFAGLGVWLRMRRGTVAAA